MKCILNFRRILLIILSIVVYGCSAESSDPVENQRYDILFISIDDLRNDLGAVGVTHIHTPQLDAFASEARLFSRHFVHVPTCGASRAALLRGKRADNSLFLSNDAILNTHKDWGHQSLPAWFRKHGYKTFSLGKITHYPGGLTGENWTEDPEELPGAWDSAWIPDSPWKFPQDMMHGFANGEPRVRGESPAWESYDGPDTSYPDGWVANEAENLLEELAGSEEPWFFAVGFFKPHLPFAAPQSYFDLYDLNEITEPENTELPPSPSGWHGSGEMMGNYGHNRDPRNDKAYARQLRHAYAAATSYIDAQVGYLMDTFYDLGLNENTIVVVWSDHGFALGEQNIWGKHSLYEVALKSPLIIQHPGMANPGIPSDAIVETVDLFPTLTELSGLPVPDGLHGRSLKAQLTDPGTPSEKSAFAHYTNGQATIRDENRRLIVHRPADEIIGYELFDFRNKGMGEQKNPEEYPDITTMLLKQLEGI